MFIKMTVNDNVFGKIMEKCFTGFSIQEYVFVSRQ